MRRNNLKSLEKKLRKKMSRFNVCNLIELLTQLALVLVTRPGPWQARQVESTLFDNYANFEEVSPQHSVICAVFQGYCDVPTTDSRINHHHHHHITTMAKCASYSAETKGSRKYVHL